MTADEFEREHHAPLAPDERMWRHPAEHADVERNKHLSHAPPLGRRLTALTAIVCLIASLAVLAIAVPKGISEYVESEAASDSSLPLVSQVKTAVNPIIATVNGAKGSTTAISLGHGCWIVSADAIDITERMWLTLETGEEVQVRYVSSSTDGTAALLHLTNRTADLHASDWDNYLTPKNPAELRKFSIVDTRGTHHLTDEESFQLQKDKETLPLTVDTPIDGAAAIVDEQMTVVGVVVMADHSTHFLRKASLLSLLSKDLQAAP